MKLATLRTATGTRAGSGTGRLCVSGSDPSRFIRSSTARGPVTTAAVAPYRSTGACARSEDSSSTPHAPTSVAANSSAAKIPADAPLPLTASPSGT